MNQSPFAIQKTGFVGMPVFWSGTVWATAPVFAADGVTVVTAGTPRDISGWVFRLTVKSKYSDPDSAALFQLVWTIGVGTSGVWGAEWPAADTVDVVPQTVVWDLQVIITGLTEPTMLAAGNLTIGNTVGTSLFTAPV